MKRKSKFGLRDIGKAWQDKDVLDKVVPIVPHFSIDPKKTALLVLDMNYVCAHRDYGIGLKFPTIGLRPDYFYDRIDDTVVPNIQKLLARFRDDGLPVLFTVMGTEQKDLSDLPETWRKTYPRIGYDKSTPGNKEFEIMEEVKPLAGEPVLTKRTSGAFVSTDIQQRLQDWGVQTLVITGVETDCCVYNTAIEANDRGYQVIVPEDATTTLTRTGHKLFLEAYGAIFFFNVRTTEQVLAEVQAGLAHQKEAPALAPEAR
ncbi:MAG: isochorismatase family cysteine hydrolase [Dehalococcoidia bacterium]